MAAVAAVVGVGLIARPRARVVSASNVVAVVWIVLYTVLTVQQADEIAAWTTDVFLIVLGAAADCGIPRGSESETPGTIS